MVKVSRSIHGWTKLTLAAALLVPLAGCQKAPEDKPLAAAKDGEWARHGYNLSETRFSPLTQINADTVAGLKLAWFHDLDTNRGQESTPIMKDGKLFTTSAWSKVQAFDAATGKLLWSYDPEVPGKAGVKGCCDVVNRGVAVEDGRVFLGTFDGRLIALDENTGKVLWSVVTVDQSQPYTITGAPRLVKGKVLIGNGGAEYGVRGYVTAYDMKTGQQAWRFYTVPGKQGQKDGAASDDILEKLAGPTWKGKPDNVGGGGTVWDSMAYDPDLDLLYIGVGNGSPWNQSIRSPGGGDNLFLASIVAVRPETGEYVWHYQETPGDEWDYTATQQMILTDLTIDGKKRKVLMQAPKNGFFYVLDRTNGKLISATPYTQQTWTTGVDMKTGRPKMNPDAYYNKTGKPWVSLPGFLGAHNWQPMAYNPQTGLVYIPVHEIPTPYIRDENFKWKREANNLGLDLAKASMPADKQIVKAVKAQLQGRIVAWDPVKRKAAWTIDLGAPWNGGILTTAGGLLFQGTAAGDLKAYDARTGKMLWSYPAQSGIVAPPITYATGGKQYVSVVAGWGGVYPLLLGELAKKSNDRPNRSRVLTFSLDGTATLPEQKALAKWTTPPPPAFGTPAQAELGMNLYSRTCGGCHGDGVRSGGVLPELRRSKVAGDAKTWRDVVIGGLLEDNGMASFARDMTPEDAEAIRAYVLFRANQDWKSGQRD
ncbi:PQQ-dependent dehydrogenase, methanol/ethanol family [Novosphingobium beihaiensis]|uniref:PQQ-dependent dehydrogenase, methanol/ethanol family n=1 Tax=Novosphingobium beihaiensis TaxID=2930389 RepID=A0ABT0BMB0_9SPHN|nr:PQQ-dependent dehydrogenase, methanol/ethanol family [Novosphingobium beihaiensis]MCJ2185849.1 PQQ-dependent dehydrogenase, methanol/ethanol family [Novosphingobium beihaiensis]